MAHAQHFMVYIHGSLVSVFSVLVESRQFFGKVQAKQQYNKTYLYLKKRQFGINRNNHRQIKPPGDYQYLIEYTDYEHDMSYLL